MPFLSIETATKICSVALHDRHGLLASSELHQERSHAAKLTLLIDQLIQQADIKKQDLAAIIVSKGPGSFTGLRIGTSVAKGLCFGLNLPLVSVNTLDAMAYGLVKFAAEQQLLCPMIDARRMEVYLKLFDSKFKEVEQTQAKVVDAKSFDSYFRKHEIIFFGNGSSKCKQVLKTDKAKFINDIHPSAIQVGALGIEKFKEKQFEDLAYYEPYYLKDFQTKKPKSKLPL